MLPSRSFRFFMACLVCVSLIISFALVRTLSAEDQNADTSPTSLTVEVKDYDAGTPISQARLTLQFSEPGGKTRFKIPKKLSYSAKTNAQGRYKFTNIYKGTIRLLVTADQHQSFGKEYELEKDNQVIEVKLKKPQPLL